MYKEAPSLERRITRPWSIGDLAWTSEHGLSRIRFINHDGTLALENAFTKRGHTRRYDPKFVYLAWESFAGIQYERVREIPSPNPCGEILL